jgi:hypothetical protein
MSHGSQTSIRERVPFDAPLKNPWSNHPIWITLQVMDERDFYTQTPETKKATYTCPKCRQTSEFQIRWMRRTKKKSIPPGASDLDRAKFAKATDYLVRVDDQITCPNPRCRKRFDIPNDQTIALL